MRQYRKEDCLSYALGMTVVFECLKWTPKHIHEVFFHSKLRQNEHTERLIALLNQQHIPYVTQDKIFNILSPKENCFVIASVEKYEQTIDREANHLVLVEPENAGNLGTILRTALGFGIRHIAIIGPSVDPFDPKTIRASMGALFGLSLQHFPTFAAYKQEHSHHHFYPFMLQTANLLGSMPIEAPYALIFGKESSGLDRSYLNVGTPLRIAHEDVIDSLNLTNAISIALYEANRDRQRSS